MCTHLHRHWSKTFHFVESLFDKSHSAVHTPVFVLVCISGAHVRAPDLAYLCHHVAVRNVLLIASKQWASTAFISGITSVTLASQVILASGSMKTITQPNLSQSGCNLLKASSFDSGAVNLPCPTSGRVPERLVLPLWVDLYVNSQRKHYIAAIGHLNLQWLVRSLSSLFIAGIVQQRC